MPELPEVETVVRTLEHLIKEAEIVHVNVLYDNLIEGDTLQFCKQLEHKTFTTFNRRGKYIILGLDNLDLIVHLRMEGKFYVRNKEEPYDKHTHVQFFLSDQRRIDYHDTRKFGRMKLIEKNLSVDYFKKLGPEPFDETFNEDYIKKYCINKKIALKKLLLDQGFVAGIGNIYADEVCFKVRLHPLFPVHKLTKKKRIELVEAIRAVLNKAIAAGGSTIRSYTSSLGVNGLFQLQIDMYGRENKPCVVCQTAIKKIKVQTRGTCFCPQCQRMK